MSKQLDLNQNQEEQEEQKEPLTANQEQEENKETDRGQETPQMYCTLPQQEEDTGDVDPEDIVDIDDLI